MRKKEIYFGLVRCKKGEHGIDLVRLRIPAYCWLCNHRLKGIVAISPHVQHHTLPSHHYFCLKCFGKMTKDLGDEEYVSYLKRTKAGTYWYVLKIHDNGIFLTGTYRRIKGRFLHITLEENPKLNDILDTK